MNQSSKWVVDGIDMTDGELIQAAANYGYNGSNPEQAAAMMKSWDYDVKPINTRRERWWVKVLRPRI